jgi:uncharacterized protein YdeI (YjbR/CyaY-like superfamily)
MPDPVRFRTPAEFRSWLRKSHGAARELVVCLYKTRAADRGLTYAEALDEALCFGWIDGIRKRLDDISFSIRFTPRRPGSIWSRINVAHVRRLIREGRMQKSGLAAFQARTPARTGLYSFERAAMELRPAYRRKFRLDAAAWAFFVNQAPSYRRTSTFWVMSAKREETRLRRLELLIACCADGTRIPPLARP